MKKAPFGTWKSEINAKSLVAGATAFKNIAIDQGDLYLLEGRPEEAGRCVFVDAITRRDLFPPPFSARTQIHEYGGMCGLVHNQILYFSNATDQQIYQVLPGKSPSQLTFEPTKRFGDFQLHPNGLWLFAVVEDHADPANVSNGLARIDLKTGKVVVLCEEHDFYIAPRINPKGDRLAFISWDHPNMPWDSTRLSLLHLDQEGNPILTEVLVHLPDTSVLEPSWSPEGVLYYVSDQTGFWNIYCALSATTPLLSMAADFASPPWGLGNQSYTFFWLEKSLHIAAIYTEKAIDYLCIININTKRIININLPYTSYSQITAFKDQLLFIASSPVTTSELIAYDIPTATCKSLAQSRKLQINPAYFSVPEKISFPTEDQKMAFAFYYPPKNPHYCSDSPSSKPPLILYCHGGPTAHATPSCSPSILFWTSRGFAVALVNYGGSTGYGREYRSRLNKAWGILDVDDCCNAALYLVKEGLVDPDRLAIRGSSAGGYTTLAALTFKDLFTCGTSLFGVSDLELLGKDTHKFEAHYLDSLIGAYPAEKERYRALSPIHHKEQLSRPVLLLQGAEDKIVPPNQAEEMYLALKEKNIPTKCVIFPGEGHGFRKSETIIAAIEEEYEFYCSIFAVRKVID